MRVKKSNAQLEFERAQRNLRGRIESAEKAGYEFNNELKRLAGMKYSEVSPQKAVSIRREFARLNTEMLRRSKYVESGVSKISGKRLSLGELQEERRARNRAISQAKREVAAAKRAYNAEKIFGSRRQEEILSNLGKEKDIIRKEMDENFDKRKQLDKKRLTNTQEYMNLRQRYREIGTIKSRNQYIINFFNGAYSALSIQGGTESDKGYLLWLILNFMSTKVPDDIEKMIDWLGDNDPNIFIFVYESGQVGSFEESGGILEKDLYRFAKYLESNWGFRYRDKMEKFQNLPKNQKVVNSNSDTTEDPYDWIEEGEELPDDFWD